MRCDDDWAAAQRLTLREGEKGWLTADYLHAHNWFRDGTEASARRHWHLWVRRETDAQDVSHYCLLNAPLDTSFKELARGQANASSSSTVFVKREMHAVWRTIGCGATAMAAVVVQRSGTALAAPAAAPSAQHCQLVGYATIIAKRHQLRQQGKGAHARRSQVARELT